MRKPVQAWWRMALAALAAMLALPLMAGLAHADDAPGPLATNPIDVTRESSLTVRTHDVHGAGMPGVHVAAYRVAGITPSFPAVPRFAGMLERVGWAGFLAAGEHSADEWDAVAATLRDLVMADDSHATAGGTTGSDGTFRADKLVPGIYLVVIDDHQVGRTLYTYAPSLVGVPGDDGKGGLTYDVVAQPKFDTTTVPEPGKYRVVKQWNDSGHEQQRPVEITVDIYADGKLSTTQVLSAANHWTYEWEATTPARWTAVEHASGLPYTVRNSRQGTTLMITNTWKPEGPKPPTETVHPPKTGVGGAGDAPTGPLAAAVVLLASVALHTRNRRHNFQKGA